MVWRFVTLKGLGKKSDYDLLIACKDCYAVFYIDTYKMTDDDLKNKADKLIGMHKKVCPAT